MNFAEGSFCFSETFTVISFHLKKYAAVQSIYSHLTLTSTKDAHRVDELGTKEVSKIET